MLTIRYTELAEADLLDIYLYTYRTWGAAQANRYADTLRDAIYRLAEEPERAGTVDRSTLYPGSRSYLVKRHLIFYRAKGEFLEILRVLHGSMDIQRRLDETAEGEK